MSVRGTDLAWALTTLCAWAVFLSILSGRPELLVLAACPGAALAFRRIPDGFDELTIKETLSSTRLNEGEELVYTLALSRGPRRAMVALLEVPSFSLTGLRGANHRIVRFDGPGELIWERRFTCSGRGKHTLGDIFLRAWDWSGQCVLEARHTDTQDYRVYPRLENVGPPPRPPRTQLFFGNRPSPHLGEGLEPAELRPFLPGDRVRRINWRASLRRQRLYVTQFHEERNADVVMLVDSLSQVGPRFSTSLDCSVRAAASLGAAYLRHRDRVGFIEYGGYLRWLRPATGRRQALRLLDALLPSEVFFTYIGKDLGVVPRQVLPAQALIIAFSPLIDDRFVRALEDLAAREFDIMVVNTSAVELTRSLVTRDRINDLALRFWKLELRSQLDRLRRRGIPIVEWRPAERLNTAVAGLSRRSMPVWHRS